MGAFVTEYQTNQAWTLTWKASGRYPIVADRIYSTLADAQEYVDDLSATASATPGLIISVINDNTNNGIYYIQSIAKNENGEFTPGVLVKAGSNADDLNELTQDVNTLKIRVGAPAVSGEPATPATGLYKEIEDLREDISKISKFSIEVVSELPTSNVSETTIYLLKDKESTQDLYTEYIYVNGAWENLGKQTVDLTGYAKSADVYSKTEADTTFVKVVGYNSYTEEEKTKLSNIESGAQVNKIEKINVVTKDGNSELAITDKAVSINLSNFVKDEITVNEKPLTQSIVLGSLDIKLDENISRIKDGNIEETVYTKNSTVHAVLSDISSRIDNINAIVGGQIEGIASISAGDGIAVTGETSTIPTVSVKLAAVSGLHADNNGLSVKVAEGSAIQKTDNGLDIVWTELN